VVKIGKFTIFDHSVLAVVEVVEIVVIVSPTLPHSLPPAVQFFFLVVFGFLWSFAVVEVVEIAVVVSPTHSYPTKFLGFLLIFTSSKIKRKKSGFSLTLRIV
jgi:hypothetical protein